MPGQKCGVDRELVADESARAKVAGDEELVAEESARAKVPGGPGTSGGGE